MTAGHPGKAAEYVETALKLGPRDLYRYIFFKDKGIVLFVNSRYEDAASTFEESIASNPEYAISYLLRAAPKRSRAKTKSPAKRSDAIWLSAGRLNRSRRSGIASLTTIHSWSNITTASTQACARRGCRRSDRPRLAHPTPSVEDCFSRNIVEKVGN